MNQSALALVARALLLQGVAFKAANPSQICLKSAREDYSSSSFGSHLVDVVERFWAICRPRRHSYLQSISGPVIEVPTRLAKYYSSAFYESSGLGQLHIARGEGPLRKDHI